MKIVAILESSVTSGGGFNQSLNAILQMQRLVADNFQFSVITSVKENIEYLQNFSIKSQYVKVGFFNDIFSVISASLLGSQIIAKLGITSLLEKKLIKERCDLVYFVKPSIHAIALQKINYIITVWDLCHRDNLEFPEVHFNGVFIAREWLYRNLLPLALLVLVDSEILAKRMVIRYGIDRNRVLSMPFAPSPFIDNISKKEEDNVLSLYGLDRGYFFYPAQFWPHKNHIRILQALTILNDQYIKCKVVFVGGDQGNLNYIEAKIKEYDLEEQVKILGFVPVEHIKSLYENCQAVVMPTYFGPTNLPPLEAWSLGKPLIYSNHLKAQAGDAAIMINPDSAEELADAMKKIFDDTILEKYVARGYGRLKEIDNDRKLCEDGLMLMLESFDKRRECWVN